jgi:hypothetical protein
VRVRSGLGDRERADANPAVLDDHDGAALQVRLDRGEVGQQQRCLLAWTAAGMPVEQQHRRLSRLPGGQQFPEVRISRQDHPLVPGSMLEDVHIRGVQAKHLTNVDRIMAGLAQHPHDDR